MNSSPSTLLASMATRLADVEAIRSIRRLQHAWGHYAEAGDTAALGRLFTDDARLILPTHGVEGRAAIDAAVSEAFSPRQGRFDLRMMLSPVITVDGDRARARWHELALSTRDDEDGIWSGGIQENTYRRENGRWRIATLHLHPQFSGAQLTGWSNLASRTPEVPTHFTPDQAGMVHLTPPAEPGDADASAGLNARADAAVEESRVTNLINAYAFYMDRRSWDDVADLFAPGADVIQHGRVASGREEIRALLEENGPTGLRDGEVFDHLHTMPIVTLSADRTSAKIRSIELSLIAEHGAHATWSYAICEAHASLLAGQWQFTLMRTVTRRSADHFRGWGAALPADAAPALQPASAIGFPHPVDVARPVQSEADDLASAEHSLRQAAAFDAAENVSCAYGYFLDDARWTETAALFAANGWKELSFIGTYFGRERILESLVSRYGTAPRKRDFLPIHQKLQPYVTVSDDGQRAQVRLKMLQVNSGWDRPASVVTGVYENQVILEDGVWRIDGMDLEYLTVTSWADGWVRTPDDAARIFAPTPEAIAAFSPAPDACLRGQTYAPYPRAAALGFHFLNPVSGRAPALLLKWSDGRFDAP